jgi:hypothetical protein
MTKAKTFRFCRHRLLRTHADAIIAIADEFMDEQNRTLPLNVGVLI